MVASMAPSRCIRPAGISLLLALGAILCFSAESVDTCAMEGAGPLLSEGGGIPNHFNKDSARSGAHKCESLYSQREQKDAHFSRGQHTSRLTEETVNEGSHTADTTARLLALESTLLEQEQLALELVKLLEMQRQQINQLLSESTHQDCSCPCRQLAEWHSQRSRATEKAIVPPVKLEVTAQPVSPTLEEGTVSLEKLPSFDLPESPSSLVAYQERLVVRPRVGWSDHFKLLAAVEVGAHVSCLHTLHQESEDGLSQDVVVGDSNGALHIFHSSGHLVLEYSTEARSPVTSMVSFSKGPSETWLVSGHSDGSLLLHSLMEWDVTEASEELAGLKVRALGSLRDRKHEEVSGDGNSSVIEDENRVLAETASNSSAIMILQRLQRGRSELLLAADAKGSLEIFDLTERRQLDVLQKPSRILAFMKPLSASRVVLLAENGVGRVDLAGMEIRPVECTGLGGLRLQSFVFDAHSQSKGYGILEGGKEMITVQIKGEGHGLHCEVLSRRKSDFKGKVTLQAIRGYLLVRSATGAEIYNTSMVKAGATKTVGPRPLFTVPSANILEAFSWHSAASEPEPLGASPLLTTNKDRLVVLSFPGGLVAMYRSELPIFKAPTFSSKWLGSRLFVGIVLLVATWQIILRRPSRESTFSAEGLGKWTEHDLREFVKRHVNGQDVEKKELPSKRSSLDLARPGSQCSSREASVERLAIRDGREPMSKRHVEAFNKGHVEAGGRPADKENHPPLPARQGSARKDEHPGPNRNVLGNSRVGGTAVNGRGGLMRAQSLQVPRSEKDPHVDLTRSSSLENTRPSTANAHLDAFLENAGFGGLGSSLSGTTSVNSDGSLDPALLNTSSASKQGSQAGPPSGVNAKVAPEPLANGKKVKIKEQARNPTIPCFTAEDFSQGTGAPQGVLSRGESMGGLGRVSEGSRKLQGAQSAETRDLDKLLAGINMDELGVEQPKSW